MNKLLLLSGFLSASLLLADLKESMRDYNSYAKNIFNNDTPAFEFEEGNTRQLSSAKYLFKKTVNSVVYVHGQFGTGSGIIVGPNHILTNYHVVHDGSSAMYQLYNKNVTVAKQLANEPVYRCEVMAVDKKRDLALLKTDERLRNSARLARNSGIEVADGVFAIGHPLGELIWSFTEGTISALPSPYEWDYDGRQTGMVANCIQTQTPINPGNSGGPLFNDAGELVGVNSFGYGTTGLNFAVRIDEVSDFIKKAKKGKYPKGVDTPIDWIPVPLDVLKEWGFAENVRSLAADTNFDGRYNEWWFYSTPTPNADTSDWSTLGSAYDWNSDGYWDMTWDAESGEFLIDANYDGYWDLVGRDTDKDDDNWPDDFKDYVAEE
tara:strand:- start:5883 stop:7016 length:1134 start_codon:yes stop_codon:yes gene_type:complete